MSEHATTDAIWVERLAAAAAARVRGLQPRAARAGLV
jgi:hypothetical protein